jgi:hypothetical protein
MPYDSGEEIRHFIVRQVDAHPADIAKLASDKFGIEPPAIRWHLRQILNKNGDAKIIYPTAAKWAQEAAMLIHGHIKLIGHVTDKGVKSLVKGLWAKIIEEAANQEQDRIDSLIFKALKKIPKKFVIPQGPFKTREE